MPTPDEIECVVKDCNAGAVVATSGTAAATLSTRDASQVKEIISFGSEMEPGSAAWLVSRARRARPR